MRAALVLSLGLAACSFRVSGQAGDGGPDVTPDAPPANPKVRFTSVTADVAQLRPGLYGLEVTAVLRNELDTEITDVAATLSFATGSADRAADFRWRDLDRRDGVTTVQPATIAANGEATYRFKVDALASAAPPGPILVNGAAVFATGGSTMSATPRDPALDLGFAAMNPAIVVTTATDESNGDGQTSFREAIARANTSPGLDRIVFDPTVFPPGMVTATVLQEALGALPDVTGGQGDLVIDGGGAGFAVAVEAGWASPDGRWGLRLLGGSLVIHGIGFRDLGYNYLDEGSLASNNCGGGQQREGGAIRVNAGTLVLDGATFADPNVAERNCYASSVRIEGGSGHRILNNLWTDQSMDSMFINAAVVEISGNVMNAGATPTRVDECIFIASQGGQDLWITGNLCVDQEYSAIIANGTDAGTVYLVNNTFVRDGRASLSAVRRAGASRAMVLRNNVYVANNPAAIQDSSGTNLDLAYEALSNNPLCNPSCPNAVLDGPSIVTASDLQVASASGQAFADFTPQAGSPLVDTGIDWIDRNGSTPGRYNGAAPERGAVELP